MAFAFLLIVIAPDYAAAQSRVQSVTASPIWFRDVVLCGYCAASASTSDLSAGADTVLHVWSFNTNTQSTCNDDFGGGPASAVVWSNPSSTSRTYRVFVRAASGATTGTADVDISGVGFFNDVPVGAAVVDVVDGTPFIHETVSRPMSLTGVAGTTHIVLGLDTNGSMTGFDVNGGVGAHARYVASSATRFVSVGTWDGAAGGALRLISHNPANDPDGDGVDSDVENHSWYLTCPGGGAPCPYLGVHTTRDTDRDGLTDGAEIFGIDSAVASMYLPRWGANPRHKDLFVEIDYRAELGSNPFQAMSATQIDNFIDAVSDAFRDVEGTDILNPNGSFGVNVHLDAGVSIANVGDRTRIGAWGGGGTFVAASNDRHEARDLYRAVDRRAVFRYAMAVGTGTGQASIENSVHGGTFDWNFGAVPGNGNRFTFIHELGHSAGLYHFGHFLFNPALKNGSPAYDSLMNYCHQNSGHQRFSDGDAGSGLNPANVDELDPLPASIPLARFLDINSAWRLAGFVVPPSLDFNRDGVFNDGVRAPLTACGASSDHAFANEEQDQFLVSGTGLSRVALSRGPGSRLYAFSVFGTALQYRSAPYSGTLDASCPNGDGIRAHTTGGIGCMNWTSGVTVTPPSGTWAQFVTLAPWGTGLAVAIRASNGNVYTGFWATQSSGVLGSFSGWTNLGVGNGEPSLSIMHVDPAIWGSSMVLGLFFYNSANEYLISVSTAPPSFSPPDYVRDQTGARVSGASLGATVVPWPDPSALSNHATVSTACGVFPDSAGTARVFCLDRDDPNRRWTHLTAQTFGCSGCMSAPTSVFPFGFQYHVVRESDGSPLHPASHRGNFWLTWQTSTANSVQITHSEPLRNTVPPDGNLRFRAQSAQFGNQWTPGWGGVSLYSDLTLGALKALWIWRRIGPPEVRHLRFSPTADGSLDADLGDASDWQIMEHGICHQWGVRPSSLCGTTGYWGVSW